MYGMDTPIHLTNQADYEQGEIDKIKKQLKELGA